MPKQKIKRQETSNSISETRLFLLIQCTFRKTAVFLFFLLQILLSNCALLWYKSSIIHVINPFPEENYFPISRYGILHVSCRYPDARLLRCYSLFVISLVNDFVSVSGRFTGPSFCLSDFPRSQYHCTASKWRKVIESFETGRGTIPRSPINRMKKKNSTDIKNVKQIIALQIYICSAISTIHCILTDD